MRWGLEGPLFLVAAGILGAWPAFAAEVKVIPDKKSLKGAVMLNHGQGYAPLSAATVANTGDSVFAFTGGLAKIVYPDGCTIDVTDKGAVYRVSETSPCKGPGLLPSAGFSGGKYLVGAAIVGGAIGAAVFIGGDDGGGGGNHDHEPHPRSPE
jgi:hypothetical protein